MSRYVSRSLLSLPGDILVSILCTCEVEDVLALEMTCTLMHKLVATRQVWLAQLRSLDQYHAPDLPPHISVRKLSMLSLRSKVLQAIKSYRNWNSGKAPVFSREMIVRLPEAPSYFPRRMPAITLIPGGEYLSVFWLEGVVEIIDVRTSKIVWMYPPLSCRDVVKVEEFGVEPRDDGSLINIMCMRRTSLHSSQSMVIFVINRVEPQQNRAIILFQQPFHEDPEQYDCVECAKICGDFAVVCLTNKICVINWADADCVELSMAYFVDCIEIVGLHIICAQHAEDANSSLVLISIKHIFDAAKPKRGHSPRSYRTGTLKSRWRRLDYADAIVQLIHLGLPDQSTIITQRLAAFMPSWQKEDSDSAVQTSTIHFVQFLELPDDPKQYFNMHKLTFHPGRYHSESSLTDSRSTSNMELPASLTLDTRMTIINPVPDTVRTTYGTGMSQSGRAVIACVERDADMFAHFAFSMANIEGKNVKQCAPLVLPRITKGYSLDMEAYSGAVLYTNFPSEVVIRYYD